MNYCVEENGMNQPLTIQPNQISFDSQPQQPTQSTDVNPTSTTPGFTFTTPTPRINVTLNQPTTLTLIYLPNDRPNNPSNVKTFTVQFVYPNGTISQPFTSTSASSDATTTTTTRHHQEDKQLQHQVQVELFHHQMHHLELIFPSNFDVPAQTIITMMITLITDTTNDATGVCSFICFYFR